MAEAYPEKVLSVSVGFNMLTNAAPSIMMTSQFAGTIYILVGGESLQARC